jgi:hypothetical protein
VFTQNGPVFTQNGPVFTQNGPVFRQEKPGVHTTKAMITATTMTTGITVIEMKIHQATGWPKFSASPPPFLGTKTRLSAGSRYSAMVDQASSRVGRWRSTIGSTSATETWRPSSALSEVTPASRMPHGTKRS